MALQCSVGQAAYLVVDLHQVGIALLLDPLFGVTIVIPPAHPSLLLLSQVIILQFPTCEIGENVRRTPSVQA